MRKEREKDNRGGFRIGAGRPKKENKIELPYEINLGDIVVVSSEFENVSISDIRKHAQNAAREFINESKAQKLPWGNFAEYAFKGILYRLDMAYNIQFMFRLYEGQFTKAQSIDLLLFVKQVKALNLPIEIRTFVANHIRIWRK